MIIQRIPAALIFDNIPDLHPGIPLPPSEKMEGALTNPRMRLENTGTIDHKLNHASILGLTAIYPMRSPGRASDLLNELTYGGILENSHQVGDLAPS